MKLLLSVMLFASLNAFAHGGDDEPRVVIEPFTEEVVSAETYQYKFQLFDTEKSRPLGESDLEITHAKSLHFVVYDPALKEFQHVHPTYDGSYWNVTLNFQVSGNYWAWAQGKLNGSDQFSTSSRLDVQLGRAAWPAPSLSDVREGADGTSRITLSTANLRAGRAAMLDLNFLRTDGTTAEITPYLGAIAHIIAVPEDGDSIIHVHTMDGSSENSAMIHVTFPARGFYRLWIEFIDGGILKRVPLSVRVN